MLLTSLLQMLVSDVNIEGSIVNVGLLVVMP